MPYIHNASQVVSDPEEAFHLLKNGNRRYVSGETISHKIAEADWQCMQTSQHPFAIVLGCADSRVCLNELFDQRQGDLFVVRNAGNVADPTALGSIEYAVSHLNVPLVVVCGHSNCGAVGAAIGISKEELAALPGNLKALVGYIHDSIGSEQDASRAEKIHAIHMADIIRENPVVQQMGARVMPAYYELLTGQVAWL